MGGAKRRSPAERRNDGHRIGPSKAAPEHREAAQAHVPEVLETWVAIMRSDAPPGTRAHMGELIYSRAHGRPTPEVEAASGPMGIIILPAEDPDA